RVFVIFFFFQAEDGIRDRNVTGVQTCALPIFGLILGQTPVSRIPGALDVSNVMLYIIVALIASQSDFSQIAQAPIYLVSGFLIMLFHLAIMLLLAKLFKYDLFTLGIASLA